MNKGRKSAEGLTFCRLCPLIQLVILMGRRIRRDCGRDYSLHTWQLEISRH